MRIHRVTMVGFGPFRDTETVDFDGFDDDGIFLITGRTGAGKTSILDAVTYALFGRIPRFDDVAGDRVRSDHIAPTDRCEVTVELSTVDGRYRVLRSPQYERPKKKGEGTTTEKARFELSKMIDCGWEVIEDRLGNAEVHVGEIVKLDAEQFQQVVLLAQGRFQEFLVADSARRRDLLRTLFNTRRFDDYTEMLRERASTLRARLQKSITTAGTYGRSLQQASGEPLPDDVDLETCVGIVEWATGLLDAQRILVTSATERVRETEAVLRMATETLDAVKAVVERQERRAKALQRRAELDAAKEQVASARQLLDAAHRADLALHAVTTGRDADAKLRAATEAHGTALEAFRRVSGDASTDPADLRSAVEDLTRLSGSIDDALAKERMLPGLAGDVRQATEVLEAFDAEASGELDARTERRAALAEIDAAVPGLESGAAELDASKHRLEESSKRLAAAEKAAATSAELRDALDAQISAGKALSAASTELNTLRERRLAGHAGELAAALVEGEPCAVCGSTVHPAPATLAPDHVEVSDIEAAEQLLASAQMTCNDADQKATVLETRLEAETEAAGGETVEALTALVVSAERARDVAAEATVALAGAKERRRTLAEEIETLTASIESSANRRVEPAEALATAQTKYDDAVTVVATARGAHGSVAERHDEVMSRRDAGRLLLEAAGNLTAAEERAVEAAATLSVTLTQHGFTDADEVDHSLISESDKAALQETIHRHDSDSAAVASTLEELAQVPEEPVDLTVPTAAQQEADSAAKVARGQHTRAEERLRTFEELTGSITDTMAAVKEDREAHEVIDRLAMTVRGQGPNTYRMMLETFALTAELEEIVAAANTRLAKMTGRRYELVHSDAVVKGKAQSGLNIEVMDAHTGAARPPQSLSGGEKFQASLALALGLAEVVTARAGGLTLDTLFIDEGFGSLDVDTLETTMETLNALREGGRTIGLISHVEAMKESIPAQLHVEVTDGGWSTIRA